MFNKSFLFGLKTICSLASEIYAEGRILNIENYLKAYKITQGHNFL